MNKLFLSPAFYVHLFNSFLTFIAFIMMILYYPKLRKLDTYEMLVLVLLFTLVICKLFS